MKIDGAFLAVRLILQFNPRLRVPFKRIVHIERDDALARFPVDRHIPHLAVEHIGRLFGEFFGRERRALALGRGDFHPQEDQPKRPHQVTPIPIQ